MEESTKEKTEQEMPKSSSASHSSSISSKEEIVETDQLLEDFSSPTPAKTREPSRKQSKEELVEFSEKYRNLLEFFNRMTTSLRLLGLCKRSPTFQNISSQVEIVTGRKFLTMHLAQIKYILPEALQIDKFLIHDEQTKCMVPDMKIELLFDIVEDHGEESPYVALSNLFSSRLKEFSLAHPEDVDVPEAVLPGPFNQKSVISKEKEPVPMVLSSSSETEIQNISHFSPSFTKRFHQKSTTSEMEKIRFTSHTKSAYLANKVNENEKSATLPDSAFEAGKSENTPIKLASGCNSILVETPVQSTPMRSISPKTSVLTCEDEIKATLSQKNKQPSSNVKKSLHFNGMEDKGSYKHESVGLSDLVPLIHQIFRSVNFCPITKEALVHKIIMFSCDVDDQSEVETQMEHLEKLVPDWFFKKLTPSGDVLYNVEKASDLNSVCERINVI